MLRQLCRLRITRRAIDARGVRFCTSVPGDSSSTDIVEGDDDLDPYWKGLESRTLRRSIPRKPGDAIKPVRTTTKKTEADVWLEEGFYETDTDADKNSIDGR